MNSSDVPALNAALSKLEHPTLEAINEVINRFTAKDDHIPQSYTLNTAFREKINKYVSCIQMKILTN
jgi:hypothetical protein